MIGAQDKMFQDRLRTKFAGLDVRTPVSVAPHAAEGANFYVSPEHAAERLMEYVERGASKVAIQFTAPQDMKDYPAGVEGLSRWGVASDSSPMAKGFKYLYAAGEEKSCIGRRDVGLKTIELLKKQVPEGVLVEADIVGGSMDPSSADSWAAMARDFEAAGADVIECDTSCDVFAYDESAEWGALKAAGFPNQQIGDNEEALKELCSTVSKAIRVPFGWKMTPETGWPRFLYLARASLENGATWVAVHNCNILLSAIDIYNDGKPDQEAFPFAPVNTPVASTGYGRATGRRATAAIRNWVPEIEVIGITGITTPEYAVEYLMLGAQIVELASGIFFYGPQFIDKTVKFIDRFLEDGGYQDVDQIRGRALAHTNWDGSTFDYRYGQVTARIDKGKCIACMRCGGTVCFAISHDEAGKAEVEESICAGCGLCVAVCPSGAAKLYAREEPKVLDLARGVPALGEMIKWEGSH